MAWEESKHPRDKEGRFTAESRANFDNDYESVFGNELSDFKERLKLAGNLGKDEFELSAKEYFVGDDENKFLDDEIKKYGYNSIDEMYNDLIKKDEAFNDTIDYENVEYPKGTSKEYTQKINKEYEKSLPVIEKVGLKVEDFEYNSDENGFLKSNVSDLLDKYVFQPYNRETPNGDPGDKVFDEKYEELYNAIMRVDDKLYNDWWIRNK